MRQPDSESLSDWMDERVEAFLDESLPADEAAAFERRLAAEEAWRADFLLARRIRDELRALPEPACPAEVSRAVSADIARAERTGRLRARLAEWFEAGRAGWSTRRQPAVAMALLAAVVGSAALLGRLPGVAEPAGRDLAAAEQAEVERALAEAKWALAFVSGVGRETGRSVRHEVIGEHVVGPMQEALGTIVDESINRGTDR